jgi:hypothetical protein
MITMSTKQFNIVEIQIEIAVFLVEKIFSSLLNFLLNFALTIATKKNVVNSKLWTTIHKKKVAIVSYSQVL